MPKILLALDGKIVFKMSIKKAKNSKKGDFDIMLESKKRAPFDHVIAGNFFRSYKNEINAVSWHGFYKKEDAEKTLKPVVHFKNNKNDKDALRHFGAINANEQIPFPVCSVYIPSSLSLEGISNSGIDRNLNKVIDIDELGYEKKVRFDFFVLPRGTDIEALKCSKVMVIYSTQPIDAFNGNGDLTDPEHGLNLDFYNLDDDVSVMVRSVCDPEDMFDKLGEDYSLVIIEPNDVYNILNRPMISVDESGNVSKYENMQVMHESHMGKTK